MKKINIIAVLGICLSMSTALAAAEISSIVPTASPSSTEATVSIQKQRSILVAEECPTAIAKLDPEVAAVVPMDLDGVTCTKTYAYWFGADSLGHTVRYTSYYEPRVMTTKGDDLSVSIPKDILIQ